jgi:transcription termination factor Rho
MNPSQPTRASSTAASLQWPHWSGSELHAALLHGDPHQAPTPHLGRDELLAALFAQHLARHDRVDVDGVLELLPEGFGFLRFPGHDLAAGAADVFVSPSQVRGLNLKDGHRIRGPIRPPRGNERYFALLHIDLVHDVPPEVARSHLGFAALTPLLPTEPLPLATDDPLWRTVARLAPWCRGQRVLLRCPASWPRCAPLATLAQAIAAANADVRVHLGLFDQRPEDLAAAKAQLAGLAVLECVGTAFDAPAERHAATASLLLAQSQREVEAGAHVVLVVDALTTLARAGQLANEPSGRYLAPGLDAAAVQLGKRLFASARKAAEGGSLTVLAVLPHGGEHQVDAAIAREFAGRSHGDVVIDAALAAAGNEMPLDLAATRTRPEDDVASASERTAREALRAELLALAPGARAERLRRR